MRRFFMPFGLAALWLSPFLVQAQPETPPLTRQRALELASSRSPVIAAAQHAVDASDGAWRQAGTLRNPALDASVEDTRRETRSTTLSVGFPLELGGKRAARIGVAERAKQLAEAGLDDARAQVKAAVIEAWVGVLVAQQKARLMADSAALASRAALVVARRVAAGKLSPVDETRARVDVAQAQLAAIEADAELQAARRALATLWGDADLQAGELQGDVEPLPSREPVADLVAALDASPSLRARRLEAERQRALVELEHSRRYPDLTLSVGGKRDNELGRTQAIVGLSIPLPLFDRNQGAVQEAASRARQADDEFDAARLRLATQLQLAAGQLAVARASAQSLQDTVLPAAAEAHAAAMAGFEAGKFGFLDVIDAQRALLQARARHLAALSSSHQAAAAIDRLLGR